MDFIPGDFISYTLNNIPYQGIVMTTDTINKQCLVGVVDFGYVRINNDKLTLNKLNISQKLFIIRQLDPNWIKKNKRLFSKILTDTKLEYSRK